MFNRMEAGERFGPAEQTPAQRQALLDEVEALKVTQGLPPLSPFGQRLYRRYVAGELSLAQLIAEVNRVHRKQYPTGDSEPAPVPVNGVD